jgi:hypothetical protein
MRFPDPSSLVLFPPSPDGRARVPTIPPLPIFPSHPAAHSQPVRPLPSNLDPSQFIVIPPVDANQPNTPVPNARRFDNVLYGDSPSKIDDATTRFVLNNPNGVTRDGMYDHLTEFLLELLELGVDVIQLPESNVDWRHPNEFRKCQTQHVIKY